MGPESLQLIAEAIRETMPEQAEMVEPMLEGSGDTTRFFAFDTRSEEYLTNFNIVSETMPFPVTMSMLIESLPEVYAEMGAEVVSTQSDLEINGLAAGIIRANMPLQMTESEILSVNSIQYIILHDDIFYILSFSTDVDHVEHYTPIFEGIAQSFKIQEP